MVERRVVESLAGTCTMTASSLRLWRLVCIALLGGGLWFRFIAPDQASWFIQHVGGMISSSDSQQRRISLALAILALIPFATLPLAGAIWFLTKAIRAADAREAEEWPQREREREIAQERMRAEEAARRWEEEKPARQAAEARALRWAEARKRAISTARTQYPEYVDIDELEQRAWWDESYDETTETTLLATCLDPAEVVLKYGVPGEREDAELRLYLRERVERLETNEQVIAYRKAVLAHAPKLRGLPR
jgi:hypothetical protein